MEASMARRVVNRKAETKCLTCSRERRVRGLCSACHAAALKAIREGRITEAEAIARGLILKSRQGQRSANNEWDRELAKGAK